ERSCAPRGADGPGRHEPGDRTMSEQASPSSLGDLFGSLDWDSAGSGAPSGASSHYCPTLLSSAPPVTPHQKTGGPTPTPGEPAPGAAEDLGKVPPELADHPRYKVLQMLGEGGMGAVFKAEHRLMGRVVALKVVNRELVRDELGVARFQQEVRAAARLAHPHIVTAYRAEQGGKCHLLVMEYVEGVNLAGLISVRGPLPVGRACELLRQVALGLQHAHEQGMVHRDVKPHNLMITRQGQVKILDFGLARLARERE